MKSFKDIVKATEQFYNDYYNERYKLRDGTDEEWKAFHLKWMVPQAYHSIQSHMLDDRDGRIGGGLSLYIFCFDMLFQENLGKRKELADLFKADGFTVKPFKKRLEITWKD